MDKIFRRGADVSIALQNVQSRRLALYWQEPTATDNPVTPATMFDGSKPGGWRAALRRAVRLPLKVVFHAVRPVLRPLTFRIRRYMQFEVRSDLQQFHSIGQHAIERVAADLLRETQASREQLRHELLAGQQHAVGVMRTEFAEQFGKAEAATSQHSLHLLDRMFGAQQEAFVAQARHFEDHIGKMEEAASQRLADSMENLIKGQLDALAEYRLELERRIDDIQAASAQRLASVDAQRLTLHGQIDRIDANSSATARRVIIPADDGRLLIKTHAGYVVCPSDDLAVVSILVESGDLEPGTRKLIGKLLEPGDVYVDVGANLGLHTIAAGRAMQHRGKIIAFEPFPRTRALLHETLHINGLLSLSTVHQVAVSEHAGHQLLYLGNTCGHHSLFALSKTESSDAAPIHVDTVRLDDVLADEPVISLLKIDAEGAELDIVRGAATTLAKHANIGLIVEFGVSHLARNSSSTAKWLDEFGAFGFEYRAIDPETGMLENWTLAQLEAVDSVNLLFARPAAPIWAKADK